MKYYILKVRTSNTLKGSLVKKIQNVRSIVTQKWKARKQILDRARGKSESRHDILHAGKKIKKPASTTLCLPNQNYIFSYGYFQWQIPKVSKEITEQSCTASAAQKIILHYHSSTFWILKKSSVTKRKEENQHKDNNTFYLVP